MNVRGGSTILRAPGVPKNYSSVKYGIYCRCSFFKFLSSETIMSHGSACSPSAPTFFFFHWAQKCIKILSWALQTILPKVHPKEIPSNELEPHGMRIRQSKEAWTTRMTTFSFCANQRKQQGYECSAFGGKFSSNYDPFDSQQHIQISFPNSKTKVDSRNLNLSLTGFMPWLIR